MTSSARSEIPRTARHETDDADGPGAAADLFGGEFVPGFDTGGLVRSYLQALRRTPRVLRASQGLATELIRVLVGTSDVTPADKDPRFTDDAWQDNPAYRRLGQAYLAWCRAVEEAISPDDMDDWRNTERARLATAILTAAMAPTNTLLGNPAALKRAFDTGGRSLLRGVRNYLGDLRHNSGMPSLVDRSKFTVGEDLAVSPGAVVLRDDVFELIQYRVPGDEALARPLVIVPPQINKYYMCDLRPGRSLIEYLAEQGIQVFMMSWKNPGRAQRDWDLGTYVGAVNRAIEVAGEVTGSDDVNVMGLCAGGQTAATALAWRAAEGIGGVTSLSFLVTLLDFSERTMVGMFDGARMLRTAKALTKARGVLKGSDMKTLFAWFRPDDLVFPYVVNNYLMGNDPPAFDILAWNDDSTNLPAGLHRDFMTMFSKNGLGNPGSMTVAGQPIDLGRITCDSYVVGGETDHITPWRADYRTVNMTGGESTFVFTNTGHIQTVVCPPGQKNRYYRTGPEPSHHEPDEWLAASTEHEGSWWVHYVEWLTARSGERRATPASLGSERYPSVQPAPGSYIHELA